MLQKKLFGLQYLRAIAAIIVIIHHAQGAIPNFSNPNSSLYSFLNISTWGRIGVDIFFVISGFIIFQILQNTNYSINNCAIFIKKRFLRVAPLYWFYSFAIFIVHLDFVNLFSQANIQAFNNLLLSISFIPNIDTTGIISLPILPVGWTLILEVLFYSLAALFFLLFRKAWFILLSPLILISIYTINYTNTRIDWLLSNLYLIEFILGMIIGAIYQYRASINYRYALISLTLGIFFAAITIKKHEVNVFYLRACASFFIVFGILYLENKLPKKSFFAYLGDASYTLYLSHVLVFTALSILFKIFNIHIDNAYLFVFLLSCCAISIGLILYKCIEVPLVLFLKKV